MSNKRQTAVDWLIEQVSKYCDDSSMPIGIYQHAKEMDKQQKMDAFMEADYFEGRASKKDFEQYYTETYNTPQP